MSTRGRLLASRLIGRLIVPWKDVLIVDDNLELVPAEALDATERAIGCKLPAEYRAIMTAFGGRRQTP
jgi:hypothetical protein